MSDETSIPPPVAPIIQSAARGRQPFRPRHLWVALCRIVGITGVLHETFFTSGERPVLLIIFGALLGVPTFARFDLDKFMGRGKDGQE